MPCARLLSHTHGVSWSHPVPTLNSVSAGGSTSRSAGMLSGVQLTPSINHLQTGHTPWLGCACWRGRFWGGGDGAGRPGPGQSTYLGLLGL